MNGSDHFSGNFTVRIPEESRVRLDKARVEWVNKHVEREIQDWKRRNPGPGYSDHPMAIDRYEETVSRLTTESEMRWADKFDQEVLPEALDRFIKTLEADD